jgi:L-asparaginase
MPSRPRVLVLSTGGTLGMLQRDPGALAPSEVSENVLKYVQGLDAAVDLHGEALWNLDSSDMGPTHWTALAEVIAARREGVDGIVVLHGTDTMAWTASALSFALSGLDRPVVLTGAQRPIAWVRSDARTNVVNSALCAGMGIPEVCVYFGRWLFRGNRVTKTSIQSYEAFESPDCNPLLELGVEVRAIEAPRRPDRGFSVDARFDPEVAVVTPLPGSNGDALDALVARGMHGVVVRAFGSGNVPQAGWPDAIARATEAGVAVVLASQSLRGRLNASAYEGGLRAVHAGAMSAGAMTVECATVKLMAGLGRGLRGEALADFYAADLAGEGV